MTPEEAERIEAKRESQKAMEESVTAALRAEAAATPPPEPPSVPQPKGDGGTSPPPPEPAQPAPAAPDTVTDDYDEEDLVEPPEPAVAKPTTEDKPTETPGAEPPTPAWDVDRIKSQYPTEEARLKALAEAKAHIERQSAELKALKEKPPQPEPSPAAAPPADATPPPADDVAVVQQAIRDLAKESPHVAESLRSLQIVKGNIEADNQVIADYDAKINAATDVLTQLEHTLTFHEAERKANPEDVATLETIRTVRERIIDAESLVRRLERQRQPIIDRRNQDVVIHQNAAQALYDMGGQRVRRSREQAEELKADSELQAKTVATWDATFPRVVEHYKIPQEHREQIEKDLAREMMAEINPATGAMVDNIEAWLMERMPIRKAFLESVRGQAFTDYTTAKRADAELQPAPKGPAAVAKPEPEPAPGDVRGEMARSRRMLAEQLSGFRRRA